MAASPGYETLCSEATDGEAAWLAARRNGIGASEIGGVLGISPWHSPLSLYAEKVGAVKPDRDDVEAIKWGKILEPVIAQEFSRRTGRPVVKAGQLLRSREEPWALATLDYWCGNGSGDMHPLEIKNVTAYKAEDWVDGVPPYYLAQLQQQMFVTGSRIATAACLLGGNRLLWCDLERSDHTIARMRKAGGEFWQRVVDRQPPPPDESEASKRVLHAMYPLDDGSSVTFDLATCDLVEEWRALKEKLRVDAARAELLENKIKSVLGAATEGWFPSGERVSWKAHYQSEYVVPAKMKRPLRFHSAK